MVDNTNLDRTLLQKPEKKSAEHAGDIFGKAFFFNAFTVSQWFGSYVLL